jgi:enamine deaminase RidA (YjgF/YER057c/UK114 family)
MSMEDYAAAFGFSVSRRAGGLVFFSGHVGFNPDGSMPSDPASQYACAFEALGAALAKESLQPSSIVELLTFHTRFPEFMEAFAQAKAEFLGDARPTWTAIGVAALGTPETLVEIKATALAEMR